MKDPRSEITFDLYFQQASDCILAMFNSVPELFII